MSIFTTATTLFPSNTTLSIIISLNNTIATSKKVTCQLEVITILLIVAYTLVFVIGISGNILVLIIFKKGRKSVLNLLIIYLAICDMMASLFTPVVFIYWIITCEQKWDFGYLGCMTLPVISRITTSMSIGILLIMAIDRCLIIILPFKRRLSRRNVHQSILITLTLCTAAESQYIYSLDFSKGTCDLKITGFYLYGSVIGLLLRDVIFVVIFISTTVAVFLTLRDGKKSIKQCSFSQKKRCRHVMMMFATMATLFGLTVIPRDIFHVYISMLYLLNVPKKWS